jgi:hypothetical protein
MRKLMMATAGTLDLPTIRAACHERPLTGNTLLVKISLTSRKVEIVTFAETFQD